MRLRFKNQLTDGAIVELVSGAYYRPYMKGVNIHQTYSSLEEALNAVGFVY